MPGGIEGKNEEPSEVGLSCLHKVVRTFRKSQAINDSFESGSWPPVLITESAEFVDDVVGLEIIQVAQVVPPSFEECVKYQLEPGCQRFALFR